MSDKKPPEPMRFDGTRHQARITANAFWLDLGLIRQLVASVEDLPDDASVTFEGLSRSHVQVDRWYAKEMHVEHQALSRAKNPQQ